MTESLPSASRRSVLAGLGAASVLGAVGSAFAAAPAQAATSAQAAVDITTAPFTVAAVRAASVEFDLVTSIAKAGVLIAAAAAKGAKLVVFGELWLPGYPKALNFDSTWVATQLPAYAAQSLTVGDRNWQALRVLADRFNVYLSIGYSERDGDYLYMGQALFGPDGTPLIVRRKVRPSGSERAIWSDDDMSQLKVVPTGLGRIGMLECWEHLHPQMTFNELAQKPSIHIAAWPYTYAPESTKAAFWEDVEVARAAVRNHALQGFTYAILTSVGHAEVYSPLGLTIAKATADEPGDILYATIDPTGFSNTASDPSGEFSWGVLNLIRDNYPGPKVADPEHGTKHRVKVAK